MSICRRSIRCCTREEGKSSSKCWRSATRSHVRGIALTPTQGLARGMAVEDTGGPLKAPVGKGILSRMFDVFGNAIDREAAAVRCPMALRASGSAAAGTAFHQVRNL